MTARVRRFLGGGQAKDAISWGRFYVNWTGEQNLHVAREQVGWLIDLMMVFIANPLIATVPGLSSQLLYYTHDFTIQDDGASLPVAHKRAIDKPERPRFEAYLITFLPKEEVALIIRDRDILEVFFPFPSLLPRYEKAIGVVMQTLLANWVRIPAPKIRNYTFFPGFFPSNIWIPYFACLRLIMLPEELEQLFLDPRRKDELETRALFTYKHIGQMIALCLLEPGPTFEVAQGLFGPNSPPFTLNNEQVEYLGVNGFAPCKPSQQSVSWFNDIRPVDLRAAQANAVVVPPNFIPVGNAPKPRYNF